MFQWIKHNNPNHKFKILDYTYTSQPSINSALPLKYSKFKYILFIIGVILSVGFVWLFSKWSNKRKAIMLYDVCSLEQATHFLIEQEDVMGGSKIVKKIDKFDVRNRINCISFSYHERNYLFYQEKQAFLPIRYEQLGIHLDQLRRNIFQPYSKNLRPQICEYYGVNVINLPVQTRLQIFTEEMLTPYEVFQTYAILLWIFQGYYIFSFILLGYALYTYWQNSTDVVANQQKLARQSFFEIQCKVIINQNDNIGPLNMNDQAQIQRINETQKQSQFIASKSSQKDEMIQQQSDPQIQLVTMIVKKRDSNVQADRINNILDKKKVKTIQINSKQLVPGDILILHQGDVVPCDCIILKGEILIDESYITGQKYLTRKCQLQNFTYKKQSQNNFTIYLGSKIAKIKNQKKQANMFISNSIEQSIARNQYCMENQIVCLVINTNFNTLRGKYLRAIRYQKKHTEDFTRETIYFIYILIGITTVVFLSMIGILQQGMSGFMMFFTFIDLIFVCIPPTLPTILSVGINFAQHRLKNFDISCVMSSNILTGGKVDTIVLEGQHALGKQYDIESMMIGIKKGGGFGQNYPTVQKFYTFHEQNIIQLSSSSLQITNKKKQQRKQQFQFGQMFLNAVSVCHSLQYFQNKIQGNTIQKKVFEFSECKMQSENVYQTKNHKITLNKKIFFKEKQNKIAVVATIQDESQKQKLQSQIKVKNQLQHFSLLDQGDEGLASYGSKLQHKKQHKSQQIVSNQPKKILFVKGNAEKMLHHCLQGTFPKNSFDYVVDMAEKGFTIVCYAYTQVDQNIKSSSHYMKQISKNKLVFLGFLVLKQIRYQDNIQAINAFKKANIKVLLVSQQRELQTTSVAILNQICDKKQVLLCSQTKAKNKIYCKGHIEWQSSWADPLPQFVQQFQDFGKNSCVSLMSSLYEQLFMRRDSQNHNKIFEKSIIFNKMQYRHERNLYNQLQKRSYVSFAVGGGGIVSQCANLSMELQRDRSSLLSSFHTKSKSLMTIFHCLRICRAGLATNFHVFSMNILFSIIQFTTVCLLYVNYQEITDKQMLYEDLFITFPIFITINLTKPASRLSKQKPLTSFFDLRVLSSMLGQITLQFVAQLSFILYLHTFKQFRIEKDSARKNFIETGDFTSRTVTVIATFVLSNYLYLGVVLSTSVSKPFRKPFYTNPWYTLILAVLWIYNTIIVVVPSLAPAQIRPVDISVNEQQILILAMIIGNLMMVLMYLFQNLLSWSWRKWKSRKQRIQLMKSSQTIQMKQSVIQ